MAKISPETEQSIFKIQFVCQLFHQVILEIVISTSSNADTSLQKLNDFVVCIAYFLVLEISELFDRR